jgi:hypothetical protein
MRRRTILYILLILTVAAQLSAQTTSNMFRISGKTVNAVTGQIMAGVEVSIGKAEQMDSTLQRVLTGDDGAFTFTVSEPGKYGLAGQGNGFRKQGYEQHGGYFSAIVVGPGLISEHLVFRLHPDARIVGAIVDEESEAVSNALIYLFRTDASAGLSKTYLAAQSFSDDRGRYRFPHLEPGRYFLVVSAQPWFGSFPRDGVAADSTAFDVVFPTTFYPGVTDSASASQVVLKDGEEFAADFTLSAIPALHVRLTHFNADPAQPRGASLKQTILGTTINLPWQREMPVDDSIEIGGLPPGRYVLDVDSYDATRATRSTLVNLTSNLDLDADGASGMPAIRGTIRMDGGLTLRPQAFVRLWNSRTNEVLDSRIDNTGQLSFDSGFLAPGSYSVFAFNGDYSTISSLSATGAHVAGQSIQIAGSRQIQLDIVLSRTLSTVNGTARRAGQPFAGAMIILVPENPEINLPLFRRDQSDSDGTFTLRDVLPGRYKILAIENAWDLEWSSLEFLKPRLDHAESAEVQPSKTYQTVVNVE